MSSNTSQVLRLASNVARIDVQRNSATTYVAANEAATDPVQGLFVEKIREYATRRPLVESLLMLQKKQMQISPQNYGGGKCVDMSKFPNFKWAEPAVENPDLK